MMTITALCWTGNFIVGRWAADHVPPLTLAGLRWIGATLIMLALAWPYRHKDWPILRQHMPMMVMFGLTGAAIHNALQYVALNYTTATSASVINASGPILIALSCYLFFGDRVSLRQALGILSALCGVLVVISKGDPQVLAGLSLNIGDLAMLAAIAIASVYMAFMRRRPPVHALSFALGTFVVAALAMLPMMGMELALGARFVPTTGALLAIAYVAVVPSVIAYLCLNRGLELLGGTRAGVFLYLIPLFTAGTAVLLLGERPAAYHAAGLVLIVLGLWISTRQPPAPKAA